MNRYTIAFYCPDAHIRYDVRTLDQAGLGGGATSRLRLAHALAARGNAVTAFINCPRPGKLRGVRYERFGRASTIQSDVLIATTSGGALDLGPLARVAASASIKILLVHGTSAPGGAPPSVFGQLYAPSNFIRRTATKDWGWPGERILVTHRGVVSANFAQRWGRPPTRDPFALAYAGHPSKGLEAAREVLRRLRSADRRFALHVFGSERLWGDQEVAPSPEPGMVYHGLIGQRLLARELQRCTFSLNLQAREEPFGLTIVEAQRAGCIVLASPVGAYPELIRHGRDGFLVPGAHTSPETHLAAAELILRLARQPGYAAYVRRNALAAPLDWEVIARAWEGHWEWLLSGRPVGQLTANACAECGGSVLPLADGLHCVHCGNYQRELRPA